MSEIMDRYYGEKEGPRIRMPELQLVREVTEHEPICDMMINETGKEIWVRPPAEAGMSRTVKLRAGDVDAFINAIRKMQKELLS